MLNQQVTFDADGQIRGDLVSRVLLAGGDVQKLRANATTLREKEWEQLDNAIIGVSRSRLIGISDLLARPELVRNVDAMSTTAYTYDKVSDLEPAEITMRLSQRARNDRLQYTRGVLPLPFVAKFFEIDARELGASRKLGNPLDTGSAEAAAAQVAHLVEDIYFNGASTYTAAGGTLYGLRDFPSRNTVSMGTSWATDTGDNIMTDVAAMIAASVADNHFGPWMLYLPPTFAGNFTKDLKAASDKSIIQRVKEVPGIIDVKFAGKVPDANAVLVEMSPETIRLVVGLPITNIPWNTVTGDLNHIVATCMIPLPIADANGNCGIVHCS